MEKEGHLKIIKLEISKKVLNYELTRLNSTH